VIPETTMHASVHLAGGALQNLGNNLIAMFTGWAPGALEAAGAIIVVVTMVRRFSLKAGIGALIAFVLVLAIFQDRNNIASMFTNQIQTASTTNGLGALPGQSVVQLPSDAGR
jgi:hypothetical protein